MKFFSFIPLILFIGIIPTFPFVYADYLENVNKHEIETECRTGQVLVFRTINNDYVCTAKSTAITWVHRSMALLVDVDTKELVGIWKGPEQKSMIEEKSSDETLLPQDEMVEEVMIPKDVLADETMTPEEEKEQMIPLPVVDENYMKRIANHEIETECRTGQVLVFRTINNDYVCTAKSTAITWVHRSMALLVDVDTKELVGIWEGPEQKLIPECQDGKELVFKFTDNSPACVKPDTKQKLIKRGWASSQT